MGLEVFTGGFHAGDLAEEGYLLFAVGQLGHAAFGQTDLAHEAHVQQSGEQFGGIYDLARLLVDMMETEKYGYYHATNEGGYISWYDFTKEIYRQAGLTTEVQPVTTAEYGLSKAARPFNSRLEKKKLRENGFTPLPTWQDALGRYLQELKRQGEL